MILMISVRNRRANGLGLAELLVALGVLALLTALALPGFGQILDRLRVITTAAQFQEAISLARNEALRRRTRVDLIPLREADWASGWQVLIDADNDHRAGPGDTVLHIGPRLVQGLRIEARLRDPKPYIAFDVSGRPRSAASSSVPQMGSLLFVAGNEQRKIIISFLGRVRSCDPVRDQATC